MLLKRTGAVLLFVLLTLLAGELILRVVNYHPLGKRHHLRVQVVRRSEHPDIGYELRPGGSGWFSGTQVEVNAGGYRGHEGSPGKFAGYRIIVLGDSIAFGKSLPVEAIFATLLPKLLSAGDLPIEVLNFGVAGYDTIQELAQLEHRGLDYRPDLVIVTYSLNDIGVVGFAMDYIRKTQRIESSALAHSRLALFVAARLGRWEVVKWVDWANDPQVFRRHYADKIDEVGADETELRKLTRGLPEIYPSDWYRSRDRIGRVRYAFRRFATLANENDFDVLLLIVPFLVGGLEDYPHHLAHRIVQLEAQRAGLETLDLTSAFSRVGMMSLRIDPEDEIHPNRRGHRIIAESLAAAVRARLAEP